MARVVYGPLVTAVKGSLGGTTFQNNPSGSIIRSRPQVHKKSTAKQTTSHAALGNLLYQWQHITQDQRDLWNEFAGAWSKENKFGESKTLTGMNWFTSVNWWRFALGLALLASPPAHTLPAAPPSFAMILSASDIKINFLGEFSYTDNAIAVWSSVPTRANTLSINQIRKLVTIISASPGNPYNITSLWETATGLDWDPSSNFPDANIYMCLESIAKSSGITSSLLCTKNLSPSAEDSDYIYYAS